MLRLEAPATAQGLRTPRLTQFLGPRYWLTWLLVGWLRLTAALPWQVAIVIHRWIGRAVWHLLPGRRLVVVRNLEICFPELDPRARLELARRSFENAAISIGEVGIAWFSRKLPPVRVEGREHLEAALAKGNGVILLSGHFTTLELTGHFVKPLTPRFAFMFRARSNALLNAVQARGRGRMTDLSFSNTDTRAMLRALRANATVWYAPDQAHTAAGAELLPFFGEPAMTNTATARLARVSGAALLPFQFRRLDDGSGYLVRFEPVGRRDTERRRNGRHREAHEHSRGLHSFVSGAVFVDSPTLQRPRAHLTERVRASQQGRDDEARSLVRTLFRSVADRRRSPVYCHRRQRSPMAGRVARDSQR